jgi:uncharacterized membrane protein YeaQ/YmgE (transglycosylase-associated protein family)
MGIASWIVLGLFAGVLAKLFMPGKDPGGLIVTIVLGIAGAFVGGFIGTRLGIARFDGFTVNGVLVATGGAVLLLLVHRLMKSD